MKVLTKFKIGLIRNWPQLKKGLGFLGAFFGLLAVGVAVKYSTETRRKAASETKIFLSVRSGSFAVGEEFSVPICLKAPLQFDAADFELLVDSKLETISSARDSRPIQEGSFGVFPKDDLEILVNEKTASNLVRFSVITKNRNGGRAPYNAPEGFCLGTLNVKGITNGEAYIKFNRETTRVALGGNNITGLKKDQDYDPDVDGKYIIGSGGGSDPIDDPNTPSLSFSIKFNGANNPTEGEKTQTVKVRVTKKSESIDKAYSTTVTYTGQNGVYSGTVALSGVPAGSGYSIYVKGSRHLQKKVRNEDAVFNVGQNTFDFTQEQKYYLEPGDLPDPENDGQQDGVVNTVDRFLLDQRRGNEDQGSLSIADLNFDGSINTMDDSLFNDTIYTRWQDEP